MKINEKTPNTAALKGAISFHDLIFEYMLEEFQREKELGQFDFWDVYCHFIGDRGTFKENKFNTE